MSDYMAQKADEQIEAGLSERDQLLQRIEELEKRNKAQVELTAEFDDQIGELQDKLTATTQALDAAVEALEFFMNCLMVVDEATIPKSGIESAPNQVVFNISCSYSRIKRARESLEKIKALMGGKKEKCPPHSWDASGERCTKCGDKDWMT